MTIIANILIIWSLGLHSFLAVMAGFYPEHQLTGLLWGISSGDNPNASFALQLGLCQGFLAIGLAWGQIASKVGVKRYFLVCSALLGLASAINMDEAYLLYQVVPALIALALTFNERRYREKRIFS